MNENKTNWHQLVLDSAEVKEKMNRAYEKDDEEKARQLYVELFLGLAVALAANPTEQAERINELRKKIPPLRTRPEKSNEVRHAYSLVDDLLMFFEKNTEERPEIFLAFYKWLQDSGHLKIDAMNDQNNLSNEMMGEMVEKIRKNLQLISGEQQLQDLAKFLNRFPETCDLLMLAIKIRTLESQTSSSPTANSREATGETNMVNYAIQIEPALVSLINSHFPENMMPTDESKQNNASNLLCWAQALKTMMEVVDGVDPEKLKDIQHHIRYERWQDLGQVTRFLEGMFAVFRVDIGSDKAIEKRVDFVSDNIPFLKK